MIKNLPSEAQWSVKVLQWLLNRNLSLDELMTDEDVLAGVVSYFVKKVKIDNSQPTEDAASVTSESVSEQSVAINLSDEEVKKLNEELDFVRCRLAGADQQRVNEVKRLEERNAELREEVVKLTQKLKASEKEIFESRFSVGKVKADLRKIEEEARDFRRDNERKETKIIELEKKIEELKAKEGNSAGEPEKILHKLDEERRGFTKQLESERTNHDQEKSKLEFLVEERDNALSEAREGQAAATREIETLQKELNKTEKRLALLEMEAIKKGVPMIRIGDQPVVGKTVADAIIRENNKKVVIDDEDVDTDNWAKKSKRANRTPEPSSSIELTKLGNRIDLSNDTRIPELGSIEIEEKDVSEEVKKIGLTAIDYSDANYILSGADAIADEISEQSKNHKSVNEIKVKENAAKPAKTSKSNQKSAKSQTNDKTDKVLPENKPSKTEDEKAPVIEASPKTESEAKTSKRSSRRRKSSDKQPETEVAAAVTPIQTEEKTAQQAETDDSQADSNPENLLKFLEVINSGLSKRKKQPKITEAKGEMEVAAVADPAPVADPGPVGVSVRRKKDASKQNNEPVDSAKKTEVAKKQPADSEKKTELAKKQPEGSEKKTEVAPEVAKTEKPIEVKKLKTEDDRQTQPVSEKAPVENARTEKSGSNFPKKPVINDDKSGDRGNNRNSRNRSKSKRRGPITNIPVNLRNETENKGPKAPAGNTGSKPQSSGNNNRPNRHRPGNSGNRKPDGNKK